MWAKACYLWLLAILLSAGLAACSGDPGTGPKQVRWDRDACQRCRMVLSDPKHAAQIRYTPPGKQRTAVALFDDIGCAVLWLADQPWRDDPKVEIWVADRNSGDWLDARSATYVSGDLTPMEYGLGAQAQAVAGGLDFTQAKAHILVVEKRYNVHDAHLMQRLREQADRRAADNRDTAQHLPTISTHRE
jgi:copper chaperone NosL